MAETRTVYVYNTTYANGQVIRTARMVVGARIALAFMFSGISFLIIGIIMTGVMSDVDSNMNVGGIANLVIGGVLVGASVITMAIVCCQRKAQQENCHTSTYNPPLPGSYPAQTSVYPSPHGIHSSQTIAYPQPLHVNTLPSYSTPYARDQVNAYSAASFPNSSHKYLAAGTSETFNNIKDDNPKLTEVGFPRDPSDNPPPYSP
ncbi:hypothetical protein SK128_001577 [Halocaridina rubra]|uniref:Uncharacterized protein n=1 Tax=Halocaridina rubra TaxID=373956 RepID=A0AAN8XSK6_HALRR